MGSAVAELLSQHYPARMCIHGIYDRFCESGSMKELFKKYGLDSDSIANKIRETIKKDKR